MAAKGGTSLSLGFSFRFFFVAMCCLSVSSFVDAQLVPLPRYDEEFTRALDVLCWLDGKITRTHACASERTRKLRGSFFRTQRERTSSATNPPL